MDQIRTGSLIRQLRTERGLTQKQLAERINVSDKAVSKWERGNGCPDVSLLTALAEVLDTDFMYAETAATSSRRLQTRQ